MIARLSVTAAAVIVASVSLAAGRPVVPAVMLAVAALVVGRRRRWGHPHRPTTRGVHAPGVAHVGTWDVCRCGAGRMQGDRRWVPRPQAALGVDLRKI